MIYNNIRTTNQSETVIPIDYIYDYNTSYIRNIIKDYKFTSKLYNETLLRVLIDICIQIIVDNPDKDILFTSPPSTMYIRKEKDVDSMYNLIKLLSIYINKYFSIKSIKNKIHFENIFKVDLHKIKTTKAQHLDKNRKDRISSSEDKYDIRVKFKKIISNSKIIIMDDICTTGSTLLSCQKSLEKYSSDLDIYLFSIAH